MRNGQWVKFVPPTPLPEAHSLTDGKVVGIYRAAGRDPLTGNQSPECVVPVKPDGTNIRRLDQNNVAALVALRPLDVFEMEPITDRAELPPGRVFAADWSPSA